MNFKNVSFGEEQLLRWQYGMAGGYVDALFTLLSKADSKNFAKLHRAYPEEADAYEAYATKPGYWDDVKRRAEV